MIERDILEQWADTVASGTVPQTYGALRDQYGMCVVGVLCDIHPDLQWQQLPDSDEWEIVDKGATSDGAGTRARGNLPPSFKARYNIYSLADGAFFVELINGNDACEPWGRLAEHIRDRWLR